MERPHFELWGYPGSGKSTVALQVERQIPIRLHRLVATPSNSDLPAPQRVEAWSTVQETAFAKTDGPALIDEGVLHEIWRALYRDPANIPLDWWKPFIRRTAPRVIVLNVPTERARERILGKPAMGPNNTLLGQSPSDSEPWIRAQAAYRAVVAELTRQNRNVFFVESGNLTVEATVAAVVAQIRDPDRKPPKTDAAPSAGARLRRLGGSILSTLWPSRLPRPLATAIETMMAEQFRAAANIRRAERLALSGPYHRDREFWRAHIEFDAPVPVGDRSSPETRADLLIKCSRSSVRQTDVDRYLSGRDLPVPDFFGTAKAEGTSAAVWRFHGGRRAGAFRDFTPDELGRVVRAVAAISASSLDAATRLQLPLGLQWSKPLAARLRTFLDANGGAGELSAEHALFLRFEEQAVPRLNALGPPVLNHNDLKAPNIILTADGGIRIVDWEGASIGPPGASLRKFSGRESGLERSIATVYAKHMAGHGIYLDVGDVIWVMRGQQILWCISTGMRDRRIDRVRTGLRMVPAALAGTGAH